MWSFADTGVTLELVVLIWDSFCVPKTSPCSTFLYLPYILMKTKARQRKNGHEDTLNKNPTPHCSQV